MCVYVMLQVHGRGCLFSTASLAVAFFILALGARTFLCGNVVLCCVGDMMMPAAICLHQIYIR